MPVPIEQVIAMKQQGLTNNQILESLQRDGFKTSEIFDAITQADVKLKLSPLGGSPMPEFQQFQPQPTPGTPVVPIREEIEEVAESIIEEKWEDVASEIKKIADWRDKVEQRLHSLEANFTSLKENFDRLHSALLEKIDTYDKHIEEVGVDIKALEKVFQKVLPTFTQNVNELSRIAADFRAKK